MSAGCTIQRNIAHIVNLLSDSKNQSRKKDICQEADEGRAQGRWNCPLCQVRVNERQFLLIVNGQNRKINQQQQQKADLAPSIGLDEVL